MTAMVVAEMDLLRAEGNLRMGGLVAAAALINQTRVTRGNLPALSGSESVSVLFEKLAYEKRIENFIVCAGCAYFDRRGFGPLAPTGPLHHDGPVEGTPLHFPVPGAELVRLGLSGYTFGGPGMEMGANVMMSSANAGTIGTPAALLYLFPAGLTGSERLQYLRDLTTGGAPPGQTQ